MTNFKPSMRCQPTRIVTKLLTRTFLTSLVFLTLLSGSHGQTALAHTPAASPAQTKEEILNNARLSVQLINLDPTLKTVKLENEDFLKVANNGGNRMTAYYKGDTIYKIAIWSGLSYGVSQYEYYLKNSRPFFIYETEQGFPKKDSAGSVDRTMLALNFEGKYYLDDKGQLIDKKIKGRKQLDEDENDEKKDDQNDSPFTPDIKTLLANADSYVTIIANHLKKIQNR